MRGEQPAADAKKADGVSCVALRTLIPPLQTGEVACDQTKSLSRLMFRTVLRIDRSSRSKSSRHGDRKHGAVLRVYNNLGVAMQWRSRRIASCLLRRHSLDPMTFKELTLSVIAALMETSWPIGEPRRVTSLGLTLQRSGAAARICLPADSVQINSVLNRLRCSPNDAASCSTNLKSSKTSGPDPPMVPPSG